MELTRRVCAQVLPKIKSSQRCGHCLMCKNPHMKKACITIRDQQKKQMEASGDLPLSMLTEEGSRSVKRRRQNSPEPAERPRKQQQQQLQADQRSKAAKPQQPADRETALSLALRSILEEDGDRDLVQISAANTAAFTGLMQGATGTKERGTLLSALRALNAPSKQRIVHAGALPALQAWLEESVAKGLLKQAAVILKVYHQIACARPVCSDAHRMLHSLAVVLTCRGLHMARQSQVAQQAGCASSARPAESGRLDCLASGFAACRQQLPASLRIMQSSWAQTTRPEASTGGCAVLGAAGSQQLSLSKTYS